jgi:hypothetical protein
MIMPEPIVGMYVHQHWAYNHPYAARTWSLDDWRGYLDGLHVLGYNAVMIWPVLETMPDPLTPSDEVNLDKISRVIDMAHQTFGMCVYLALCPNVAANTPKASKYTFEQRPFFHCERRIDPRDAEALTTLVAWRAQLLGPLRNADGVMIIDSDPGGYPGARNADFARLLLAHREMLDGLRSGITLYVWLHAGWEAYCRFYETGEFVLGPREETVALLRLLDSLPLDPWGVLSSREPDIATGLGMADRVITFPYGAIEGEPSFPFTRLDCQDAWNAAHRQGTQGIFGNAQSHCLQLPNTFAFAWGAWDKPLTDENRALFAEDLLPGQGAMVTGGWYALAGSDIEAMRQAITALTARAKDGIETGSLGGLLFGSPKRFIEDLVCLLRLSSAVETLLVALAANQDVRERFAELIGAITAWQERHDYRNLWQWTRLEEALRKLDAPATAAVLDSRTYRAEGATPFEQVLNGFILAETYTTRLLDAMQEDMSRPVS